MPKAENSFNHELYMYAKNTKLDIDCEVSGMYKTGEMFDTSKYIIVKAAIHILLGNYRMASRCINRLDNEQKKSFPRHL